MKLTVNINARITAVLTDEGKALWDEDQRELIIKSPAPDVYDGPLWDAMRIFGKHLNMGGILTNPFVGNNFTLIVDPSTVSTSEGQLHD